MPDLWDDLPVEMMGDRPPILMFSKEVERPQEVKDKESGQDSNAPAVKVSGSPEIK
jgi:hypothetical protein